MRQQLSPAAILLLAGGLMVFWLSIAALVRSHGRRRSRTQSVTEARG